MIANEEEEMELSGESSLVSNLHNFSFDVSWSTYAKDASPVKQPRSFLLPAKFNAASTPNFCDQRSLTLVQKVHTPNVSTVKLSQTTIATNPRQEKPSPVSDNRQNSPMDLDDTESISDFKDTKYSIKKRHSFSESSMFSPSLIVKPASGNTVRQRNTNNNFSDNAISDDSVSINNNIISTERPVKQAVLKNATVITAANDRKLSCIGYLIVISLSVTLAGYLYLHMQSCMIFNVDVVNLQHKLEDNVFGQHIAMKVVISALNSFKERVQNGDSNRNLVMSFHGWTGVGKNFVSKFIVEAFYNARVSIYLAPHHFREHILENMKGLIKSWVLGNVTTCGVNLFIFDEIDKADKWQIEEIQEAIEILKLDMKMKNDSTSLPVTLFLFLSNSRSNMINQYLFTQIVNERERELILHSEFADIFERKSSEWYESMKLKGIIDYFVPFLPLAESHVKLCIGQDFLKKGRDPNEQLILAVMDELSFFDMGGKNGQISLTGCKRVPDKVDLHIDD